MVRPPDSWTFQANCHLCGEKMELVVKGGRFRKDGDNLAYVVSLERTEIEAHMLMHDLCTCEWHTIGTLSTQIVGGYRTHYAHCPVHGRTP